MSGIAGAIEYNVGSISDCAGPLNIVVTAALPINADEYQIMNCTHGGNWVCPCGKPLILDVKDNTINTYYFRINYLAVRYVQNPSGGGGYSIPYRKIINMTTSVNETPIPSHPATPAVPNISATPPVAPPINETIAKIVTPPILASPFIQMLTNIWEWIKKILLYKLW